MCTPLRACTCDFFPSLVIFRASFKRLASVRISFVYLSTLPFEFLRQNEFPQCVCAQTAPVAWNSVSIRVHFHNYNCPTLQQLFLNCRTETWQSRTLLSQSFFVAAVLTHTGFIHTASEGERYCRTDDSTRAHCSKTLLLSEIYLHLKQFHTKKDLISSRSINWRVWCHVSVAYTSTHQNKDIISWACSFMNDSLLLNIYI